LGLSPAARRVGVFGGSFDPPHNAHVALARAAVDQLRLDELRVVPTGQAWHKPRSLSDGAHRLAMAGLAFAPIPQAVVDDRELRRTGASYTVDTLRELQAGDPAAELVLLMGEDQALAFTTWREWQSIARMATLAVAQRGAGPSGAGLSALQALPDVRAEALHLPRMAESATDIRRRVAAGLAVDHLVPAGVASYIARHHLYSPA
jgi:nicotinate-nucleotide adenylyltransferase